VTSAKLPIDVLILAARAFETNTDGVDGACEIDDLLRAVTEAEDDDDLSARLLGVEKLTLEMSRQIRRLEARASETGKADTEKGSLTQRVLALESKLNLLQRGVAGKQRRAEDEKALQAKRDGATMQGWSDTRLAHAREAVIELLLEGGKSFDWMSAAHITEYGDLSLDCALDIETPDFIVLDALPEVLRRPFMDRFASVASLIRDDGLPPLSLARHKDWMTFTGTFA
jgi:hypothetical protein